jgi:hypothetical protein
MSQNAEIENCQMSNDIVGIEIVDSSNLTIRSTSLSPYNYGGMCLEMQNSHDIVVDGNNFQAGYYNPVGVNMISCTNCTFDDNYFTCRSTHLVSSDGNMFINKHLVEHVRLRVLDPEGHPTANLVQGKTYSIPPIGPISNSIGCQKQYNIVQTNFYGYTDKCVYLESSINTQICGKRLSSAAVPIFYAVSTGSDLIYKQYHAVIFCRDQVDRRP